MSGEAVSQRGRMRVSRACKTYSSVCKKRSMKISLEKGNRKIGKSTRKLGILPRVCLAGGERAWKSELINLSRVKGRRKVGQIGAKRDPSPGLGGYILISTTSRCQNTENLCLLAGSCHDDPDCAEPADAPRPCFLASLLFHSSAGL